MCVTVRCPLFLPGQLHSTQRQSLDIFIVVWLTYQWRARYNRGYIPFHSRWLMVCSLIKEVQDFFLILSSFCCFSRYLTREAIPHWGVEQGNFVLLHMAVCNVYICCTLVTRRVHRRFYGLDLKGNSHQCEENKRLQIQWPKERKLDLLRHLG